MTGTTTDFVDLKTALKATWSTGTYARISEGLADGAAEFLTRCPVAAGERVLDVACGAGQTALPLAAAGAAVAGIDLAANTIEEARSRAAAQGLAVRFDEGDAEDLPYADASFDLVLSLIGAMFAPRPERVVAEMLRVCRPGGRIIMGNWTPRGFIGQMFMYPLRFPFPPAKVVDYFAEFYGPMNRAMSRLDEVDRGALRSELVELWTKHDRADAAGATFVEAEILQVTAVRA